MNESRIRRMTDSLSKKMAMDATDLHLSMSMMAYLFASKSTVYALFTFFLSFNRNAPDIVKGKRREIYYII
jgi:hypothetical protein